MPSHDLQFLIELNKLGNSTALASQFWTFLLINPMVRGVPVLLPLVALWFSDKADPRRARIVTGLIATSCSIAVSLFMQFHNVFHVRPFLDPSLHLQGIDPVWVAGFNRLGSFPSDSSTLFFALSAVVLLENRIAGCVAYLATFITVGASHVVLGWHYPSDILGGLVLGTAFVFAFSRIRPIGRTVEQVMTRCEPCMYMVNALVFLFLADAYVLFSGVQGICHWTKLFALYLGKFF